MYTGREGQQFYKQEDSKFYLFHGLPDIVIKGTVDEENVRSSGENVVVLDKKPRKDSMASEDDKMAADNEIAIVENKGRHVDTAMVNNISIPEEITEAWPIFILSWFMIIIMKNIVIIIKVFKIAIVIMR